jgi:DNA-binding transcriptional MerR regulator
MSFPVDLTAALSGASVAQLHSWRRTHLLEPEVQDNPVRYSFRDVVALRTFVYLRSKLPLQRIRKAMDQLRKWDLTEHPAAYKLVTEGDSVFLVQEERARPSKTCKDARSQTSAVLGHTWRSRRTGSEDGRPSKEHAYRTTLSPNWSPEASRLPKYIASTRPSKCPERQTQQTSTRRSCRSAVALHEVLP